MAEIVISPFSANENRYDVEVVQDKQKVSLEHELRTMVASSTGDVISGLTSLLAVETDIPP
jgi:hypothetical protein